MKLTCHNLTVAAEKAIKVDFRAAFRRFRAMSAGRRHKAITRIRIEAGLDESQEGADMETIADMAEALNTAWEGRKKK